MKIPKFASALVFASALLAAPAVAAAGDSGQRATVYAMSASSQDAGYENSARPGVALTLDNYSGNLGFSLESRLTSLRKQDAKSGYTYGVLAATRLYEKSLFLEAGVDFSGYKSEFANGDAWKKHGVLPVAGIGFMNPDFDFVIRHYFQENQTENKVSGTYVRGSAKLFEHKWASLRGFVEAGEISYLNVACGSGSSQLSSSPPSSERKKGYVLNAGIGISLRRSR